jgi:S1-C subfamily serine protease
MKIAVFIISLISSPVSGCPGWLGLGFLYHPSTRGHVDGWLYVQRLAPRGPAERAGLFPGDVITAIDGQPIRYADEQSLLLRLSRISGGTIVHLTFRRGTQAGAVAVTAAVASKAQCDAWRESFERSRPKLPLP